MPALEQLMTLLYVEPVGTGGSGRLPGHPSGYTVERYTAELDGLLDELGLPPVYLIGHSHGGSVAQRFALNRPDRLSGLVLYDTIASTGPDHSAGTTRLLHEFAKRFPTQPEIPAILKAWQEVPEISDDARFTAALRALLPAYFADYWAHEPQLRAMRDSVHGWFDSSDGAVFDSAFMDDARPEGGARIVDRNGNPLFGLLEHASVKGAMYDVRFFAGAWPERGPLRVQRWQDGEWNDVEIGDGEDDGGVEEGTGRRG